MTILASDASLLAVGVPKIEMPETIFDGPSGNFAHGNQRKARKRWKAAGGRPRGHRRGRGSYR